VPFGFPAFLELTGRTVVVIGDGAVRDGKVRGLLAAGADRIVVLAPRVAGEPDFPVNDGRVTLHRRAWEPGDLDDAFLCIASSADPRERDDIARAARDRRVLVNVMDDVANCDFAAPALVRRGDLAIAISTGGRSPAAARRLREMLGDRFGPEWEELIEILRAVREDTLPMLPDLAERSRRWRAALDLDEAQGLVSAGRGDELRARLHRRLIEDGVA
jgi:precorrin-2 dehydrogenase / sirohydrochlorin ferrochelatase